MSDPVMNPDLPQPSPDHAFKRWMELGKPSLRELSRFLLEEGFSISYSGLSRMKDRNAVWLAAFDEAPDAGANRLKVTLTMLKSHSKDVDPGVFEGLGAKLIGKAVGIIDKMDATTPDDLHRVLDAVDRVKGFAHDARGQAIADGATAMLKGATNGHAKGGVLELVSPKVSVPSFNGANGHGKKLG